MSATEIGEGRVGIMDSARKEIVIASFQIGVYVFSRHQIGIDDGRSFWKRAAGRNASGQSGWRRDRSTVVDEEVLGWFCFFHGEPPRLMYRKKTQRKNGRSDRTPGKRYTDADRHNAKIRSNT